MSIKVFLYCIMIPLSIFTITSMNIEKYFKKGRVLQIKVMYLMLSFILSYLTVNFIVDLYSCFTY